MKVRIQHCLPVGIMLMVMYWPIASEAKLSRISLDALIKNSDQIMYVERSHNPPLGVHTDDTEPVVIYRVLMVLKGDQRQFVAVCNRDYGVEWPDFEALQERLVVFTYRHGGCYVPIGAYSGAVEDRKGMAYTEAISGEPKEQDFRQFLERIKAKASASGGDTSEPFHAKHSIENALRDADVQMTPIESLSVRDGKGFLRSLGRFKMKNNGSSALVLSGKATKTGFEIPYPNAQILVEIAPDGWSDISHPDERFEAALDKLTIAPGDSAEVLVNMDLDEGTKFENERAKEFLWFRVLVKGGGDHANIGSAPFLIRKTGLVPVRLKGVTH